MVKDSLEHILVSSSTTISESCAEYEICEGFRFWSRLVHDNYVNIAPKDWTHLRSLSRFNLPHVTCVKSRFPMESEEPNSCQERSGKGMHVIDLNIRSGISESFEQKFFLESQYLWM